LKEPKGFLRPKQRQRLWIRLWKESFKKIGRGFGARN
jgi:hypothetical protein